MIAITPTLDDVQTRLRSFLLDVLPDGVEVIEWADNRVPEPVSQTWVMMTPIRFPRLRTNVDLAADCRFTGSIAGVMMTVDSVQTGSLSIGAMLFGPGVSDLTRVVGGPQGGGPGAYRVSVDQNVPAGTVMSTGLRPTEMASEWIFQVDFHSADNTSADMAATVAAMFRDPYACDFFAALGPDVTPLFADDPTQMQFTQDQQQYEKRWRVEAHLQVNQTAALVPQQYADTAGLEVISVDATYPPS